MKNKEKEMLKNIISKYRKRKLEMMKERRNYKTDHGHNWVISVCQDIEIDLKRFMLGEFAKKKKHEVQK
jgi:hypothetical protein